MFFLVLAYKFIYYLYVSTYMVFVYMFVQRFKARLLLEKLRNKRLMFVGDSLNRNQWESMVCLVQSVVPPGRKSLNKTGSLSVFRIEVPSLSLSLSQHKLVQCLVIFFFTFSNLYQTKFID